VPTLNFVVDPMRVLTHAMNRRSLPDRPGHAELVAFQARHHIGQRVFVPARFTLDPREVFREQLEDPLFAPVLAETERSRALVEAEWKANYARTSAWMRELTGLPLDGTYTVYLTHPSQNQGHYLGDNRIAWAWCNNGAYNNTIYLWHELLHGVLPMSERGHAVIELLTDNELRVRLNGGTYPPWVGHEELHALRDEMLPAWREHLRNPGPLERFL